MAIYFYTARDEYGCFSNFSPHGVQCGGQYWPSVELYFQAQKFTSLAHQERIAAAPTPKEAKALGRDRKVSMRPDWDQVKDTVMLEAVRQKFRTHKAIRKILLSTGEEQLAENAPADYYWGCGADGTGENRLGKILMQVRSELRSIDGGSNRWARRRVAFP